MKRRPTCGESAEAWLSDQVWRLTIEAKGEVALMAAEREKAVHALRVAMKKLRALLRLGRREGVVLSEMEEHCRSIQKGLSPARDEEVMRDLHWELFDQAPNWPSGRVVKGWSVAKVRREVDQLIRLAAGTTFCGLTWEGLEANHEHSLKRARKAAKRCEMSDDAADFHTLRKRVKVLLYQCQALPSSRSVKKRIRRGKALAKRLGQEHDLAVIGEKLASHGGEADRLARVEIQRLGLHERLRKKSAKLMHK